MPIFSSNRVSGAGATIVAAEGYTEHDFGRILSECAINDMRLFNAAIARDFQEAQALSEGTMVASEIQALQEFSIKEAWKGLKEKLKKLWAKIKGVFKTVYAKLSLWLNRNTKAYIAQHRKELISKNCGGCKIPKFHDPKPGYLDIIGDFKGLKLSDLKDVADALKGEAVDEIVSAVGAAGKEADLDSNKYNAIRNVIDDMEIPGADKIFDELYKAAFNEPNENLTFADCIYKGNVNALFDSLSGNSKSLKTLRKMSAGIDKIFKGIIGKLNKAEAKAESGSAEQKAYSLASKFVGKVQVAANALTSASIKVIKKAISNDRGLIATLVAYNPKAKNEAAMLEFAFLAGYDALHEETEDETPESIEAAADELHINISIEGEGDVDVEVEDNTEE